MHVLVCVCVRVCDSVHVCVCEIPYNARDFYIQIRGNNNLLGEMYLCVIVYKS